MRIRTTTAAAVTALADCGGDSDSHQPTTIERPSPTPTRTTMAPTAPPTADIGADAGKAGLSPEPTGARQGGRPRGHPRHQSGLIHDEEKAVDAARDQCAALDGGGAGSDRSAAQRFSYDGVTLTDDDGGHLDTGLRRALRPAP
ncbi:hypothetical protein ACFWGM_10775 [Streptomyces roseolus]|uniref:hypothetical protein n=1 Tax=Streptomyces roseolus TaxID=67358 RepID=UPI00363271F5